MFEEIKKEIPFGKHVLKLETGKVARQASGAVVATMGDTVVLCTVVGEKEPRPGTDFFPLTVHYIEKMYACGKIPGGFNKRESKPNETEVLTSRLIDRPIRPMFPVGYHNEVQVICTVLSYDPEVTPDVVAMIGASAALSISGVPLLEAIGCARVGIINGEFVLNPSLEELKESDLDLIVAGTDSSVLMVESTANELTEEQMLDAVNFGHENFRPVIKAINEMAAEVGNEKWTAHVEEKIDLEKAVEKLVKQDIIAAYQMTAKAERRPALDAAKKKVVEELVGEEKFEENEVKSTFKEIESELVRTMALDEHKRIDGRKPTDIRQIEAQVDLLPRVHSSALFTRGETQAIAVTTLGTKQDGQMSDEISGLTTQTFMLHYNFPPYSVGEAGMLRAPGRREIGHGKLAFRAINPLLPSQEEFPYTIRVVSEVTESNGSSSMATVCGTSMSLMAAGVPIARPVAGIAMGLIKEDEKFVILSDIMGDEDHLGDMDFKVAGTEQGITALQMDIKINGITSEIMSKALDQAKDGRIHILGEMSKAISESRPEVSPMAPRMEKLTIDKDKIRDLIGPGGKNIKEICEVTGAKIDIDDDGTVVIASADSEAMQQAIEMVKASTFIPEIGQKLTGKVVRSVNFGKFVALMNGKLEGLVRNSELGEMELADGDEITVRIMEIDRSGRINLTTKLEGPIEVPVRERRERDGGNRRDNNRRGDRGGERGNRDNNRENRDGNRERGQSNHKRSAEAESQPEAEERKKKRRFF
jgi:polyribonucleotide nucleotidyltransferase